MRRWLCGALLAALGFAAHAQVTQADMEGSWQVYPVRQLSRYTLSEHQAGGAAAIRGAGVLQLNADGTLTTDVPDIEALRWSVDEGFLMLETGAGRNLFFLPRPLTNDTYFLVEVEVTEINKQIIYLKSNPNGSLVAIRK